MAKHGELQKPCVNVYIVGKEYYEKINDVFYMIYWSQ
jgi:hypothetical protein